MAPGSSSRQAHAQCTAFCHAGGVGCAAVRTCNHFASSPDIEESRWRWRGDACMRGGTSRTNSIKDNGKRRDRQWH